MEVGTRSISGKGRDGQLSGVKTVAVAGHPIVPKESISTSSTSSENLAQDFMLALEICWCNKFIFYPISDLMPTATSSRCPQSTIEAIVVHLFCPKLFEDKVHR